VNHRYSVRIPLRVEVKLSRHGNNLGRYMTRDMDSYGAFVETEGLALNPNEIVKLEISSLRESSDHLPLKAMVVRTTARGVGLMFTNYSPDSYLQMKRFIDLLARIRRPGAVARPRSAAGL
jgi:hypothetical protein